jgi:hypothetical protein
MLHFRIEFTDQSRLKPWRWRCFGIPWRTNSGTPETYSGFWQTAARKNIPFVLREHQGMALPLAGCLFACSILNTNDLMQNRPRICSLDRSSAATLVSVAQYIHYRFPHAGQPARAMLRKRITPPQLQVQSTDMNAS